MGAEDPRTRFERLEARWARLAARYLPEVVPESPWRHGVSGIAGMPGQGWKLHLAATILSAGRLMSRAGPLLVARGVMYKGPQDLVFLDQVNTGLDGYSQVGKCLTVYCRDGVEASAVARELHEATVGIPHPAVPFDRQYRPGSCVYYRYGAFDDQAMDEDDRNPVGALRHPSGKLLPDRREAGEAVPNWVVDPLADPGGRADPRPWAPLPATYEVRDVLRQRGKGAVYRALDRSVAPPRHCVVKEGLRHGETDPEGHDGRSRVRNEARALRALKRAGIAVPSVLEEFNAGDHRYVVLEEIQGTPLSELLGRRRRLTAARASTLAASAQDLIQAIHAAGWAWRDCKPENLMVTPDGELRPIDFEGASRLGVPATAAWGTPPYQAPMPRRGAGFDPAAEDRHALAVILDELIPPRGALR